MPQAPEPVRALLKDLLAPPKAPAASSNQAASVHARDPRGGNVDRLVALTRELLATFGYGSFGDLAESSIRANTNEDSARAAIKRIHEATGPPYR